MARTHKYTDKYPTQAVKKSIERHPRYWLWPVPRWYCKLKQRKDRAHNKQELYRVVRGKTDDCFRYQHRHSARWEYW
ncbi:hypothetical protein [Spirosoma harenae]